MILLVDNRDSFTWNLAHLFAEACELPQVVTAAGAKAMLAGGLKPDLIVLSPGPGRPSDHPEMQAIIAEALGQVPLLGVGLGHQALGEVAGYSLKQAPRPEHGHVWELDHSAEGLFRGLAPNFSVMRYHSLVLAGEAAGWVVDATCKDGCLMAIRSVEHPAWGLQFHPESFLSQQGAGLISNLIKACSGMKC